MTAAIWDMQVQRAGGAAVLVDAEHAFNADFAARLGVRLPELLVSQPACGEEALEVGQLGSKHCIGVENGFAQPLDR